jgi:hypothetical protein
MKCEKCKSEKITGEVYKAVTYNVSSRTTGEVFTTKYITSNVEGLKPAEVFICSDCIIEKRDAELKFQKIMRIMFLSLLIVLGIASATWVNYDVYKQAIEESTGLTSNIIVSAFALLFFTTAYFQYSILSGKNWANKIKSVKSPDYQNTFKEIAILYVADIAKLRDHSYYDSVENYNQGRLSGLNY